MKDLEMKQNILQEIMDLMDDREGDRLKSHPKLAKAIEPKVESALPEGELKVEEEPAVESEESSDEVTPEMLQMLLEKFKK